MIHGFAKKKKKCPLVLGSYATCCASVLETLRTNISSMWMKCAFFSFTRTKLKPLCSSLPVSVLPPGSSPASQDTVDANLRKLTQLVNKESNLIEKVLPEPSCSLPAFLTWFRHLNNRIFTPLSAVNCVCGCVRAVKMTVTKIHSLQYLRSYHLSL